RSSTTRGPTALPPSLVAQTPQLKWRRTEGGYALSTILRGAKRPPGTSWSDVYYGRQQATTTAIKQKKKANHLQPPLVRPRHQLTTNRHLDCKKLTGGTVNAETHMTFKRQRYFTLLPALSHKAKVSPPSRKAQQADNIHKATSEWAQQCSTTHWMIQRPHYYSYRSNRWNMNMTATLNTS
ncbi:Hypothetical predicted protein, partial [Pelobates cultripes]